MNAGAAARLRRWLESEDARAADPGLVADLRRAIVVSNDSRSLRGPLRHGTTVCDLAAGDGRRRRVAEFDRHGTLLAALRWSRQGLDAAWLRIPDRSWLRIEPAAIRDELFGLADRLWHTPRIDTGGRPLTVLEALDYDRVDRVPTLADPARLPPGAGVVMLNLLAALAADQGVTAVTYRGPFPGEQLFLALLESFRYQDHADPLAAFAAGELRWQPAPHERLFTRDDLYVQLRGRVEKVIWRGRSYHRPDWQDVTRHAPCRVRDHDPVGVRCSLWVLGGVVADHLELDGDGDLRRILEASPVARPPRPMPAAVARGVVAIVAATSAPALAPALRAEEPALEWADVSGGLVEIEGGRAQVGRALRDRVVALLGQARSPAERSGLGLTALTEMAQLLGDGLRSLAQARVAALTEAEQRVLLDAPAPPADAAGARAITDAVEALLADAAG